MIFQNSQILLSEIPKVEDVHFEHLSPAYRTVERLTTFVTFIFLLMGWGIFSLISHPVYIWVRWLLLGFWIIFFFFFLWIADRRYLSEGYALREHDIIHRRGVIWKRLIAVPFNRIQHCEISRGPIERAFNLASLRIFTAGGSAGDLAIEGLPEEEAHRLREYIIRKAGGSRNEDAENVQ